MNKLELNLAKKELIRLTIALNITNGLAWLYMTYNDVPEVAITIFKLVVSVQILFIGISAFVIWKGEKNV